LGRCTEPRIRHMRFQCEALYVSVLSGGGGGSGSRLMLYQGSFDSRLYALDAASGGVVWTWDSGGEVHSDPALDETAGVLFCATYAGYVFALKLPTDLPAGVA
jgi:outer membrane protein assembly factor BamB